MRLSYEEIERYYNNGVLEELCMKTGLSYTWIVGVLLDKITDTEKEMEATLISLYKRQHTVDDFTQEVNNLEDENNSLKQRITSLEEDKVDLLVKLNRVLPEPHYTDKMGNFY